METYYFIIYTYFYSRILKDFKVPWTGGQYSRRDGLFNKNLSARNEKLYYLLFVQEVIAEGGATQKNIGYCYYSWLPTITRW